MIERIDCESAYHIVDDFNFYEDVSFRSCVPGYLAPIDRDAEVGQIVSAMRDRDPFRPPFEQQSDNEGENGFDCEVYAGFCQAGGDAANMSDEEFEIELERAFNESREALSRAWDEGLLTPDKIAASIEKARNRHQHRHD